MTMDDWAAFLGKTSKTVKAKRMKGSKEYTEPEFETTPADKFKVGSMEGEGDVWRGDWAWSLCATKETGPIRRSWLSGRILEDGECMVHVGADWRRGVHISEVPPESWSHILGAPHGGDPRIMGQMRSKFTREAKRAMT